MEQIVRSGALAGPIGAALRGRAPGRRRGQTVRRRERSVLPLPSGQIRGRCT